MVPPISIIPSAGRAFEIAKSVIQDGLKNNKSASQIATNLSAAAKGQSGQVKAVFTKAAAIVKRSVK